MVIKVIWNGVMIVVMDVYEVVEGNVYFLFIVIDM